MSASTRLDPPKIEFSCTCGKRYRVPASKAGKRVRCKNCRLKVQVPGDSAISLRTRKAILDELGIAADGEAEEASGAKNGYRCTLCSAKLPTDEVPDAYGQEGLVCAMCRVAMGGGEAPADEAAAPAGEEKKKGKKKKKGLEAWSRQEAPEAARRKALAYAALFFLGTLCFMHSVVGAIWGLHMAWSVIVAAAVAGLGAHNVLGAYEPVAAEPAAPAKKR